MSDVETNALTAIRNAPRPSNIGIGRHAALLDSGLRADTPLEHTVTALAFAVPVVSAHDGEPTGTDAQPTDGTAEDWASWMRAHMTDQMGADAIAWMGPHMGLSVDEMAGQMPVAA